MNFSDLAASIIVGAGALTGLGYLLRRARGGFRAVDQLEQLVSMSEDIKHLVERELTRNHGTSMKDDTHATAISVHRAHKRIDEVYDVLETFAEANKLVLPLISDAIHATPPPEEHSDEPNHLPDRHRLPGQG